MSPVLPQVRLGVEAGRALVGLWFLLASLAGSQPFYAWLADHHVGREIALLSGLGLAALACSGIALVAMAVFRSLMHVIAPRATHEVRVTSETRI